MIKYTFGKAFRSAFSLLRINFFKRFAALCPKGGVVIMENIKASYETMFIVETTKGEEAVAAVVAKFKALIEKYGEVESFNEWGKRKLAYPINDLTEGYYVLVNYKAETSFVAELERNFNISEDIMRSMTVKVA